MGCSVSKRKVYQRNFPKRKPPDRARSSSRVRPAIDREIWGRMTQKAPQPRDGRGVHNGTEIKCKPHGHFYQTCPAGVASRTQSQLARVDLVGNAYWITPANQALLALLAVRFFP